MNQYLLWLLASFAALMSAWGMTLCVFAIFRRYGIVDKPHLYPHEKGRAPLPYPGGIVMMLNMFLWMPWILISVAEGDIKKALYVILAGVFVSLVMAWDDQKRSISPIFRLGLQIGVGAFFGLTAIKIGYISNIFGGIISLDEFSSLQWTFGGETLYLIPLVITIIWYVLVMNAINWSDNGRAMTSSVGLVTCVILALLAIKLWITDDTEVARANSQFVGAFLTILIPTIFVFWMFDKKHACIVGDAGSMFLGFMIATLAIVAGGKIATASIVLGIYFIDAFYVVLRRIQSGKNPMKGDLTHLHHRMSQYGVSPVIQRRLVMVLSFLFGIGAIFLDTWGKIILFCVICTVVVYITQIAVAIEKITHHKS